EGLNGCLRKAGVTSPFPPCDIIALVETWMEGDAPTPELTTLLGSDMYIHHQKAQRFSARGRASGGIIVAVRAQIESSIVATCPEYMVVRIPGAYLLVFYFQPGTTVEIIVNEVLSATHLCLESSSLLIILGDFNCRLDNFNVRGSTFKEEIENQCLRIMNDDSVFTYIWPNWTSTIELMITNEADQIEDFKVRPIIERKHQQLSFSFKTGHAPRNVLSRQRTVCRRLDNSALVSFLVSKPE